MNKLPTPRTDAAEQIRAGSFIGSQSRIVTSKFARTLERELQQAKDYADRLVEHKDMVCLPADLKNLREANAHFAVENEMLKNAMANDRDAARAEGFEMEQEIKAITDMTIAQQLKIKDFPFIIKDKDDNEIYYENADGYWSKRERDINGREIYFENSDGSWTKGERDENGNVIRYEDSHGVIIK